MNVFVAALLGLIQGVTEFLPVSSSGHLILVQRLLGMNDDMLLFNIILHIATLLAVLIVFHKTIWRLIRKPFNKTNLALVLATVVTVGFVLVFKDIIDATFSAAVLPVTFMITAIILFSTAFFKDKTFLKNNEFTYRSALATGLAQGIAVVPGFSRSGFTISAALATGTSREKAAEISFLMSIPIIIAALVYELVSNDTPITLDLFPTIIAFVVALISGIFAIKFMLKIVRNIKLYWFSLYLVVLSIFTTIILAVM